MSAMLAVEDKDVEGLRNISSKLTEETLCEVLRTCVGCKDACLRGYKVRSATAQGDNYQGSVSRVSLEGSSPSGEHKYSSSVIIKGLPRNICRRKTFRTAEFFANEIAFYEKAWSNLLAFQQRVKPEHVFTGVPRCYKTLTDGENDFIILEDFGPDGYHIPARQEGLDYAHCSTILPVLARFHALSLAVRDQEPETFHQVASSVQEIFYKAEVKPWYGNFLQDLIVVAKDALSKEMPESIYEEKLRQFTSGDLYSRMVKLVADSSEPHGVISHGDVWTANFLCKYSAGSSTPVDAKLIDFQLARCSSPALDVSLFFYSCTLQDLREQHFNTLVGEYHAAMSKFLLELGSNPDKVYPLSTFRRELTEYSKYGLCMSLEAVPLALSEHDETEQVELEGDKALPLEKVLVVRPFTHKEGRLRMCNNIKHMVDCGYL